MIEYLEEPKEKQTEEQKEEETMSVDFDEMASDHIRKKKDEYEIKTQDLKKKDNLLFFELFTLYTKQMMRPPQSYVNLY